MVSVITENLTGWCAPDLGAGPQKRKDGSRSCRPILNFCPITVRGRSRDHEQEQQRNTMPPADDEVDASTTSVFHDRSHPASDRSGSNSGQRGSEREFLHVNLSYRIPPVVAEAAVCTQDCSSCHCLNQQHREMQSA